MDADKIRDRVAWMVWMGFDYDEDTWDTWDDPLVRQMTMEAGTRQGYLKAADHIIAFLRCVS